MTWRPAPGMSAKNVEKELKRQVVLFEEKCRLGQVLDGHVKFADFTERWFRDYAQLNLRQKTVLGYRNLVSRTYFAIGHLYLDQLKPLHLAEFYASLQADGIRSDATYRSLVNWNDLLRRRSVSAAQLAKQAQVSVSVIQSLVHEKNVSLHSAQRICAALGVERASLFAPVQKRASLTVETVRHYHRFLSTVLETAVQWGMIPSNPCRRVKPPRRQQNPPKYLEEAMVHVLLKCLEGVEIKYQAMIYLLLFTGLRRGELCALQWSDIDFDRNLTHITKAASYIPGKGILIGDPKNKSSIRVVKTPAIAMNKLKIHQINQAEHRLQAGTEWNDSPLVFTSRNGLPVHPDSLSSWFHNFVQQSGLPPITLHSLRHTNATLMIANHVDIRTVAGRLGHAQTSTTMNIYAHTVKSADEAASHTLDGMFQEDP